MTRPAACVVFALVATASPGDHLSRRLEVVGETGAVVWSAPLAARETFDLSFLHSAEGCRWTQHYRERARHIEQVASTFPCYGAGMPTGAPTHVGAAGFTVPALRDLGQVAMMSSRSAGLVLHHRGRARELGRLLADGEPFVLRVR